MGSFDLNTFSELQGQGQPLVGSLGTSFGLPACVTDFATNGLLGLLPQGVLGGINEAADSARSKGNQLIGNIMSKIGFKSGLIGFDTDSGMITFGANSSEALLNGNEAGEVNSITKLINGIGEVAALGGQVYSNVNATQAQYERVKNCIDSYLNMKKFTGGLAGEQRNQLNSDEYVRIAESEFATYRNQLQTAKEALDKIIALQDAIAEEFRRRNRVPDAEPRIANEYAYLFSGTNYLIEDPEEEPEELIRLVFGPPRSITGQYLLSIDGLYYDSQSDSGIEPVLLQVTDKQKLIRAAERWKFNFDPNIGGKGDQVSSRNFYEWVNSIFDETIIDDSQTLHDHYNRDHFLKTLEGQKEKRILDINAQINQLIASGVSESIVDNFKQSLVSEVSYHNDKINRRKKQIEIAVKTPSVFGKGTSPEPGKVPINDFSYLQDCNISLALSRQQSLMLDQESVSGIVLPIRSKYAVSKTAEFNQNVDHLIVPEVGLGGIITDTRSGVTSSSIELGISDVVIADRLFGIYNFLNSKTTMPSSTEFSVLNCTTTDDYNNAQLVAPDAEFVFGNSIKSTFGFGYGLGSAYLEGITKNFGPNPSALGSYIKLPDNPEYQDWLYARSGATFDSWVYAPYLNTSGGWGEGLSTSSLYRLILSCENTGSVSSITRREDILKVGYSDGSDFTKGMIMGFTRDRRWVTGEDPTNDGSIQEASAGGFILAPTIAYDSSSVAFISKGKAYGSCDDDSGWIGMFVPMSATTESGFALSSCADEFCHLAVTFDYEKDLVSLYLDSELLAASSIFEVFGSKKYSSIKLPTFKKRNSFEYNTTSVGVLAPNSLKSGPRLNEFFTPWILGGGYTDGMALNGNFMGGEYGGVTSGLKGYLGSTKFYSKPLNNSEVNFNYKIQSKLYKRVGVSLTSTGTATSPEA